MKKLLFLLIIVVIFSLFSLEISAEESPEEYIKMLEQILPDKLRGITEDQSALTESLGLKSLLGDIFSAIQGERTAAFTFFLTLLGIILLSSVASFARESISASVSCAVGTVGCVLIFGSLSPLFESVRTSLDELSSFFTSLIPVAVGVTALGGGASSSAVQAAGMYTTVALVGRVASELLLPIAGFGLAISLLSSFGSGSVGALSRGIKSLFMWLVGILTALIGGTLSLQTMISAAQDSAAMRAARYMASGLIPVVGSTVSGALSTLAAGVGYAKGIIGGGAILALISLVLAPLLTLLIYRFALALAGVLADYLDARSAASIFSAFRFSLDMLIAVFSLSSIIYILEIILFVKAGVAII